MLWSLLRDALGLVPQLLQHSTPVGKAFSIQAFYSPLSWAWLSLSKVDDPLPSPLPHLTPYPLLPKATSPGSLFPPAISSTVPII